MENMDQEQKKIMGMYIVFLAGMLMTLIPLGFIQILAAIFAFVAFIAAYIYKWRAERASLTYNHMVYLIRTIWISATILSLGIAAASFLVVKYGDHSLIDGLLNGQGAPTSRDEMNMMMGQYIQTNIGILTIATIISVVPGMGYVIYRSWRGIQTLRAAKKFERPTAWLRA